MKESLALLFTLKLVCLGLFAQSQGIGFNHVHDYGSSEVIKESVVLDDGYVVGGDYLDSNNARHLLLMARLDSLGQDVWSSTYVLRDSGSGLGPNGLCRGLNHDLWAAGWINVADSTIGYVFRVDESGDSLALYVYEKYIVLYDIITTSDSNLLAVGYHRPAAGELDLYMTKLDTLGNMIWERTHSFPGRGAAGSSVVELPDGGFAIGGGSWDGIYDDDAWLLVTDDQGGFKWDVKFDFGDFGDALVHVLLSTDGYIYAASKHSLEHIPGYPRRKVFLGKYALNGQEVWTREYGRIDHGSDNHFDIVELTSGDILGVTNGHYEVSHNTNNSIISSAIRITSDGDSVWSKYYQYNEVEETSIENYAWALNATSDGGFFTAGFVSGDIPQDVWVTKFDSNGCRDTVNDCAVGIEETGQALTPPSMTLWPNPTNDMLNLEIDRGMIDAVEVLDATGRVVLYQQPTQVRQVTLEVGALPDGVYTVLVIAKDGNQRPARFVKSP